MRERLPLSRFFNLCSESASRWSKQYANDKFITTLPSIILADWTSAYQWAKCDASVTCHQIDDCTTIFYCPANGQSTVTDEDIKRVTQLRWTTFDQFKKRAFKVWIVTMKTDNWRSARCTCPSFMKQYKCKHSIGMAIRLKLVKPPPEAKQIPIGQKRKRGRPKKATKALLVD